MRKGISPMMATILLIVFVIGIAWVVSNWLEEKTNEARLSQQKWDCVDWRNETMKAIFPNAKIVKCYTDDYKVYAVAYNGTGGWDIDINLEDLPKEIECPKIIREDIVKQTCLKEGLNCRNEEKEEEIYNKECCEKLNEERFEDEWSSNLDCEQDVRVYVACFEKKIINETVCDEYREVK